MDYWSPIDNLALSERYLNYDLRVMVDLRFSSGGEDPVDLRTIFERELPVGGIEGNLRPVFGHSGEVDFDTAMCRPHRNDDSVFIQDIESMNDPERMIVPSVVWLETLNEVNSILWRAL